MSRTQPITIELPTQVFHQLQEISVTTQQSIEQLITQRLVGTLTTVASPDAQIPAANLHLITSLIKLALSFNPEECQTLEQYIQSPAADLATFFSEVAISSPLDLPDDDRVRQAVGIGLDALAAGQYQDYDETGLQALFEDIKRNGRLQRGIKA